LNQNRTGIMDFRRPLKSGLRPGDAAEAVAFASAP
jgi:hypothetical protein